MNILVPDDKNKRLILYIGDDLSFFSDYCFDECQQVLIVTANLAWTNNHRPLKIILEENLWDDCGVDLLSTHLQGKEYGFFDIIIFDPKQYSYLRSKELYDLFERITSHHSSIYIKSYLAVGWRNEYIYGVDLSGKTLFLPTHSLFVKLFPKFITRLLQTDELNGEHVFLCKKKNVTIVLVGGRSGTGKTQITNFFESSGCTIITLDKFFGLLDEISNSATKGELAELCTLYKKKYTIDGQRPMIYKTQVQFSEFIFSEKLQQVVFEGLCRVINLSIPYYVFEGGIFFDEHFRSQFSEFLKKNGFIVWTLQPD